MEKLDAGSFVIFEEKFSSWKLEVNQEKEAESQKWKLIYSTFTALHETTYKLIKLRYPQNYNIDLEHEKFCKVELHILLHYAGVTEKMFCAFVDICSYYLWYLGLFGGFRLAALSS